jgi:putative ABC transport system permease protein
LHPDLLLLGGSAFVFWEAVKSGYQVVLAPEGVPSISVDYFTLLAPVFLWAGAALFVRRLSRFFLVTGRPIVAKAARPMSGGLADVVAASMSRQQRLLTRGLQIVALTVTFALSTAIFDATFAAQARVDAQLTNGSDVTVSTSASSGLPPKLSTRVDRVNGVSATETMEHRFAYVGNDLQDLYGINPTGFGRAAPVSNAFFAGGNASKTLASLASRPDGVLVSDETVHDFQLQLGDLVRLRLQSGADNRYHTIPFHYVGIVREFPTAPRDSFIVANASYVAAKTQSRATQTLLVKTNGSPPVIASRIARFLPPGSGATISNIDHQLSQTLSGLPAIDLSGLSKVELAFALALAAGATGLVLALGLAERRRLFAIASALGARGRQIASFVWAEAAFVTVGGLALGAVVGWSISYMLVKILTGVFDPPPDHLTIPGAYLSVVGIIVFFTVFLAARAAVGSARRSVASTLRDL